MVQLVGILNITPDSFSDGGEFADPERALAHAEQLFLDGASIIDVGAESTRPGAQVLNWEEEWARLEPILPTLLEKYPGKISLDSYHPETILRAAEYGAYIINDVTGLENSAMVRAVLETEFPIIISHIPRADIQAAHSGKFFDDIKLVRDDLLAKADVLRSFGYDERQIILDPGIGFGKTPRLNRELLGFAEQVPTYPVMIGYSRKRFLGDSRMDIEPNLAAGQIAADAGATYLRVHDVAGHKSLAS